MYSALIKIDESLPWIELEEAFQTKAEAQKAVKEILSNAKIKISKLPKQEKKRKARVKARRQNSRSARVARNAAAS